MNNQKQPAAESCIPPESCRRNPEIQLVDLPGLFGGESQIRRADRNRHTSEQIAPETSAPAGPRGTPNFGTRFRPKPTSKRTAAMSKYAAPRSFHSHSRVRKFQDFRIPEESGICRSNRNLPLCEQIAHERSAPASSHKPGISDSEAADSHLENRGAAKLQTPRDSFPKSRNLDPRISLVAGRPEIGRIVSGSLPKPRPRPCPPFLAETPPKAADGVVRIRGAAKSRTSFANCLRNPATRIPDFSPDPPISGPVIRGCGEPSTFGPEATDGGPAP